MYTHMVDRAAVLAALALSLASTVHAQGPGPVLLVSAATVTETSARGAPASGTNEFVIGTPVTSYRFAGSLARGDANLCSVGASDEGVTPFDTLIRDYAHVWKITTTAQRIERGRLVFDLEWARYAHDAGTRPVVSHQQQLSLAEGDRIVLDLLHQPVTSGTCRSTALLVEIEAGAREDASLADTLLQYEMWLVHTDESGKKHTRRIVTTGVQGGLVPFGFGALRFEIPTLIADQYAFDIATRIAGSVRGRLKPDGHIAIDLVTARRDALVRRDSADYAPPFGGEGRKQLTLAPGEAVEVPLPSRTGSSSAAANRAATAAAKGKVMGLRAGEGAAAGSSEPFSVENGRLTVRFEPFFKSHQVALLLRATKLQ